MTDSSPPDAHASATSETLWQAHSIGTVAAQLLQRHRSAVVLAVFARSIYLRLSRNGRNEARLGEELIAAGSGYDADNVLVCVTDSSLGAGPLQICVDELQLRRSDVRAWAQPGQALRIDRGVLRIQREGARDAPTSGESVVRYADAPRFSSVWNSKQRPDPERALRRLLRNDECAFALAPGLHDELIRARSTPALCALHNWLSQAADLKQRGAAHPQGLALPQSVGDLIGLGLGLTPAGDDYLAGVLVGLRFTRHDAAAQTLSGFVQAQSQGCTNRISRAQLACVCGAYYQEIVIDLLVALDECPRRVDRAVARLQSFGHTSGMDFLAGFRAALDACR